MPVCLNPTSPKVYSLGENAKGITIAWTGQAQGDATGATVAGQLVDYETGKSVPGWTGSIMSTLASIYQTSNPAQLRWRWPNPFTPVLPIGTYLFRFVVTFANGDLQYSDSLFIQVVP